MKMLSSLAIKIDWFKKWSNNIILFLFTLYIFAKRNNRKQQIKCNYNGRWGNNIINNFLYPKNVLILATIIIVNRKSSWCFLGVESNNISWQPWCRNHYFTCPLLVSWPITWQHTKDFDQWESESQCREQCFDF